MSWYRHRDKFGMDARFMALASGAGVTVPHAIGSMVMLWTAAERCEGGVLALDADAVDARVMCPGLCRAASEKSVGWVVIGKGTVTVYGYDGKTTNIDKPVRAKRSLWPRGGLWGSPQYGIQFDDSNSCWVGVNESVLSMWRKAYPLVRIEREMLSAALWVKREPERGKKENYRRFLDGWLKRSQDDAERRGVAPVGGASVAKGAWGVG
jgi:hypothetical protein